MQIFKPTILAIDHEEARRYAGLQQASFDDALIEEACLEAQLLAKPCAIWEIYDYDEANNTVLSTPSFGPPRTCLCSFSRRRQGELVILP